MVLVMGAMAWIGLELALRTTDDRRRNDFKSPPGEWTGLGYLPADANLVLRLQLADLQEESEAKKLLAEPRPPFLGDALALLKSNTGLQLEDIDYVVLGISVNSSRTLASLVVATRKPYDPAELVKHLKAEKMDEHHAKAVYTFLLTKGRLWCPEQRIFILSLSPEFKKGSHDEFPFPPRKDTEGLSPPLQNVLKRRQKDSLAWIAGHGDWKEIISQLQMQTPLGAFFPREANLPGDANEVQNLARLETFAFSLDRDLVLHGYIFAGNEATTLWLRKNLESRSKVNPKFTVAPPPPPEIKGPEAYWVTLQARFSAEEIRTLLNGMGGKR